MPGVPAFSVRSAKIFNACRHLRASINLDWREAGDSDHVLRQELPMCRRNKASPDDARRRRHIFYFCQTRFDCRVCGRGSMMRCMSFSETIFLFFLALVIFGPKKLPEIARQVGKWMNEFRRASNEFKSQIEQEIAHLEVESKQTILPPSPPVEGTASRTLKPVEVESLPAPAMLAASNDEPSSAASDNGAQPDATEAVRPTEIVTSSSSQESHG